MKEVPLRMSGKEASNVSLSSEGKKADSFRRPLKDIFKKETDTLDKKQTEGQEDWNNAEKAAFVLPAAKRLWVVSCVQGDYIRLRQLHRKIASHFLSGDGILYLGSIIGVGREPAKTLEEALLFRRGLLSFGGVKSEDICFLKGSQEDLLLKALQLQFCSNAVEVLDWMVKQGLGTTLSSFGVDVKEAFSAAEKGTTALSYWTADLKKMLQKRDGVLQYLRSLKNMAVTSDKKVLFVPRGIDKTKSLERQGEALRWGGTIPFESDAPFLNFEKVIRTLPSRGDFGLIQSEYYMTLVSGGGYDGKINALLLNEKHEKGLFLEA